MKITGEADFFVKQYGIEKGLEKLAKLGYKTVSYSLREMHTDSTFGEWTKDKMEAHYELLRDALSRFQLQLSYLVMDRGIYSESSPDSVEARRKWCVQAVRVAAYLGCKWVVIRPAEVATSRTDAYERSKEILCQALEVMKEEGEKLGVKPAVENLAKFHIYGDRGVELLELAEKYEVGILLNPVNAYTVREQMPCFTTTGYWDGPTRIYRDEMQDDNMVSLLKKHLIGVVFNDIERTIGNPVLPLMGVIDYRSIRKVIGKSSEDICLTVAYQPIFKRYEDFCEEGNLMNIIAEYFYQMAVAIGEKEDL